MTTDLASLPYRRVRRPMLVLDPVESVDLESMPPVAVRRRG
jgi:hypothetical protein